MLKGNCELSNSLEIQSRCLLICFLAPRDVYLSKHCTLSANIYPSYDSIN